MEIYGLLALTQLINQTPMRIPARLSFGKNDINAPLTIPGMHSVAVMIHREDGK